MPKAKIDGWRCSKCRHEWCLKKDLEIITDNDGRTKTKILYFKMSYSWG